MRDFTIQVYKELLSALQSQGFIFQSYLTNSVQPKAKVVVLRHDVDTRKENTLAFAIIQDSMGIAGTYYFRVFPNSYDENIIKRIAAMGHEIGYHYETMDTCQGDVDKAYEAFCNNLEIFRKIVPVKTICMHGSPMSKFDNRIIWDKYDYRKLGLIAEPYFNLDFNKTFYITDTGRRWDGSKVSIRDKALVSNPDFLKLRYRTTFDIIKSIESDDFPSEVMMTFHPQRWHDAALPWTKELVLQNAKNLVKFFLVRLGAK